MLVLRIEMYYFKASNVWVESNNKHLLQKKIIRLWKNEKATRVAKKACTVGEKVYCGSIKKKKLVTCRSHTFRKKGHKYDK